MKKPNFLKPLFLFAFLGLCSTACNDEDGHIPMLEPEVECRLVSTGSIEPGDDYYTGFEYNEQGYVSRRIYGTRDTATGSWNSIYGETDYIYNADNQVVGAITSVHSNFMSTSTYEYTNGLLTSIAEQEPDGYVVDVTRFKYDSKKRLIERTSGESPDNYTTTYTYDNKDNLTKLEYFSGDKLTYWETYEDYDNNCTPFADSRSKNNPGKLTRASDINGNGVIQDNETKIITYTYTYNSNGYPTKIVSAGAFSGVETFDYDCD